MKQSWSLVLLKEVLVLIRNGYQYVKQKDLANGLSSWECIERRKENFKAKVKLNAIDDFVEQVQVHNHAPSATRFELTKVRAGIKRKASTTHDTTQQILGTGLANLTPTAAVNLPNLSNLRRKIRCQRQEQNILPKPPRKEDMPVLPHEYQMTGTGKRLLLFNSGVGDINVWLIPLMNFVLLFEISMMEMLTKCSTISRILTLIVSLGMPPDAILYFLSSYGT